MLLINQTLCTGSENNVLCSVSGVMSPNTAFTIDNTNIVFSEAPESTDVVDFVLVLGQTVDIGTPSDGTVTDATITHYTRFIF